MSKLEQDHKDGQNYYERELLYSIAISLKRVADSIEKLSKPPIMSDFKMTEEEYNKWYSMHPGSIVSKP